MPAVKKNESPHVQGLCRTLARLRKPAEIERFLEDLCTPAEIAALADRWQVAKLLEQEVPYREIYERTGVSTATVTRVARCLRSGAGGYKAALAHE